MKNVLKAISFLLLIFVFACGGQTKDVELTGNDNETMIENFKAVPIGNIQVTKEEGCKKTETLNFALLPKPKGDSHNELSPSFAVGGGTGGTLSCSASCDATGEKCSQLGCNPKIANNILSCTPLACVGSDCTGVRSCIKTVSINYQLNEG